MNATEQRTHRTVTRDLQTQVADLVTVVAALDAAYEQLRADTVGAIAAERTARRTMRDDLRACDRELAAWQLRVDQRTWWQRLCVVVTGH